MLETNTFGANPVKLASYGLDDETERINRAAAELAREAAGERARSWSAPSARWASARAVRRAHGSDEATASLQPAGRGAAGGGVDGFILETFSDLNELEAALAPCARSSDLPVIAQMTVGHDGKTQLRHRPSRPSGRRCTALGADVIGLNCSVGPHGDARGDRAAGASDHRRRSRPSPTPACRGRWTTAGSTWRARSTWRPTPGGSIQAGARFVGGCCGTTPDHIRDDRGLRAERLARAPFTPWRAAPTAGRWSVEAGPAGGALPTAAPSSRTASSSPRWRSCRRRGWTRPR